MPLFEHAIVIGGSLAGTLAARVLAEHAARVTVIERDAYPAEAGHRAGVPQSYHIHVLLARGWKLMEELVPGFSARLTENGGKPIDMIRQMPTFLHGDWIPLARRGLDTMAASRPLIELSLRQRVAELWPRIEWSTGRRAVDLIVANGRVAGVAVQSAADAGQREVLAADLVVDAGGRNSALPRWLERLGYRLPEQTVVDSRVGYATRWYEPPPGARGMPWEGVIVRGPADPTMRSGLVAFSDQGRWIVTLGGCGGDYPPTDEAGFLDFARSLPRPIIAQAIELGRPLAPIQGYRTMENRNRHYERLDLAPDGLIVLGDAFCALNPIYGQGMTMAALGPQTLGAWLAGGGSRAPGWSARFHRALARQYVIPWSMATGEDYRVPGVLGPPPPPAMSLVHRYLDALLQACVRDGEVWRIFAEVAHMTRNPAHLLHPRILWILARPGAGPAAARTIPSLPAV